MRNLEKYMGVIPAFYACYDNNGKVSQKGIEKLVNYYIDKGVKGVYVCGSSGECIYQSVEERKETLENVIDAAKGKLTIIAHVACNNTADSIELAKHANQLGVDAIACIPPIYFKLPEYAIAQYWNDISLVAPDCDFIIYNIPQLAGVTLTPSLFKIMMNNPKVIGVKNSSMAIQDIQTFKALGGDEVIVFNGPDEQFIGGRVIGAQAGIGGTYGVMPELFLKMDSLIHEGKVDQAMPIQYAINEIISKMCSGYGNMYAVAKEVLRINEDIDLGSVRKPLTPLSEEDRSLAKEVADMINKSKKKYL